MGSYQPRNEHKWQNTFTFIRWQSLNSYPVIPLAHAWTQKKWNTHKCNVGDKILWYYSGKNVGFIWPDFKATNLNITVD